MYGSVNSCITQYLFVQVLSITFGCPFCRSISLQMWHNLLIKVREGGDFQTVGDSRPRPQLSLSRSSFANNVTASESSKVGYACALTINWKNCYRSEYEGCDMLCPELKDWKSPPLPYITLNVYRISHVTPQMYQYCIYHCSDLTAEMDFYCHSNLCTW